MKILVVDTVGSSPVSDAYRAKLPSFDFIGFEPPGFDSTQRCHDHGWQCGYYAGLLLSESSERHLMGFARIFDGQGRPIRGSDQFILDVVKDFQPDIVTRSYGMWDNDDKLTDLYGQRAYSGWAREYESLSKEVGLLDFGAAGNNDARVDYDWDVDYPQKIMPDCVVVGSHNRKGIPSDFSGDGPQVTLSMWGESVYLLNGDGSWSYGSGTSFACPKAAGLAARAGISSSKHVMVDYIKRHATYPRDWPGTKLPHPKWGYGSLEHIYQSYMLELSESVLPPSIGWSSVSPSGVKKYQDMKEIS